MMEYLKNRFKLEVEFAKHIGKSFIIILLCMIFCCLLFYGVFTSGMEGTEDTEEFVISSWEDGLVGMMPYDDMFSVSLKRNISFALSLFIVSFVPFVFASVLELPVLAAVIALDPVFIFNMGGMTVNGAFMVYLPCAVMRILIYSVCITCGYYLCRELTKKICRRKEHISFKRALCNVGRTYAFVVLPLMIIAAIVEDFVAKYSLPGVWRL